MNDVQLSKLLDAITSVKNEIKEIKADVKYESTELRKEIKFENEEIKKEIRQENRKILEKLEKQNEAVEELNKKYNKLESHFQNIERQIRKNNIIIFGLEVKTGSDLLSFVINQIKNLLNIDLLESEINNVYVLKVNNGTPIKIEFVTYLKKQLVLRSAFRLKGTKVFITQDLCYADRQDNKLLQEHYKLAKAKNIPAKIKNNKLIVNGDVYTAEQLKKTNTSSNTPLVSENSEEEIAHYHSELPPKANSVPATPTSSSYLDNNVFIDTQISNDTQIRNEPESLVKTPTIQHTKLKKAAEIKIGRLTRQHSVKDKN